MAVWDWGCAVEWSFVVDTDQYAGNFERELCGHVIGTVDEYGEHMAGPYINRYSISCPLPMEETLSDRRVKDCGDDSIFRSPCDIVPTPGWSNDGKGNHYKVRPTGKKYRFRHPAFNSVAIFLQREPTKQELALLVERAVEFPTLPELSDWKPNPRPTILGCRLVQERVQLEETQVWSPPA